jgi:hypothetical protein
VGVQGSALGAVPLPNNRKAWDVYRLDQIWEMLRDEDGIDSFRQVAAWYRMAHLCADQADQLEKALDQLMVKWPPNPGSAAQAFKLRVEDLILSMRDSATAAKANEEPLIRITSLISDAKDAILALRQQYAANVKAETEWTAKAIVPFATVPPSPVEPGWRDALDRRARDIMHATDQAIGKAAAEFRSPTPFVTAAFESFKPFDPDPSKPQPMVPPPVFDPPAPLSIDGDRRGSDPGESPDADVLLDGTSLPLPGLGGGLNGLRSAGPFVDTPSGRVLAPGGVIGPGTGAASDRTRAEAGGALDAGGRGGSGLPGMVAPPIGRGVPAHAGSGRATRSGGRRRRRSDPDDPWVPPTGGPAVLEPRSEPDYFDPGPNVIGLDR